MLDKPSPETHSIHATYQGSQWSIFLQSILERGWCVGSVVHGILLIWGYKPATGQRQQLSKEEQIHFPGHAHRSPTDTLPYHRGPMVPACLPACKSLGQGPRAGAVLKERTGRGGRPGQYWRVLPHQSTYVGRHRNRQAWEDYTLPVCPLYRTCHEVMIYLHESSQIITVETETW